MQVRFNAFVESRKTTRLWRETDCRRSAATVYDYGNNFALDQPHALKTTTFVSSNAEWIARDAVTGQVSGEPYSVEKGSRVVSPRVIESIWFGCVSVILADHYDLPSSHLVDWNKFAVIIPESDADEPFTRIRDADWRALRENLQRVAPVFLYHRRPIFATIRTV